MTAPDHETQARYRRRRLVALGLLLVLVVSAGLVGGRELLLRSAWFRLASVTVIGAQDVSPALIRAASGLRNGLPLLLVNLAAAQRAVAAIPSVASVRASRHWPDTVELTVTERRPVAVAASPNGPRLVDRTGLAYRLAGEHAGSLPRLAVARVAPDDPATQAGLAVLDALPATVRDQLQVIEAVGPRMVILRLTNGKQVRWGDPGDSDRKAAVLAVLLSQSASVYDVSAPELPTIHR
ncbi:MAG: FtsQ-type POTRA domain-containing protein [Pseudonocardia sp.]|nr:FtsQ-type POTRA domain-containing protein [Pseudonocardia sp.]